MTSRYLLPFIHQCHVTVRTLSVLLYHRLSTLFYLKKCGQDTLKLCPWKWLNDREFAIYNMNEWTLSSGFVSYLRYLCLLMRIVVSNTYCVLFCISSSSAPYVASFSEFSCLIWLCYFLTFISIIFTGKTYNKENHFYIYRRHTNNQQ
jgi:hypothetical protein